MKSLSKIPFLVACLGMLGWGSCASPRSKVKLTVDNAPVIDGVKLGFSRAEEIQAAFENRCARESKTGQSQSSQTKEQCLQNELLAYNRAVNRQRSLNFIPPVHARFSWKERTDNPENIHQACIDQNKKVAGYAVDVSRLKEQLKKGDQVEADRLQRLAEQRKKEKDQRASDSDEKFIEQSKKNWAHIFAKRDQNKSLYDQAEQRYKSVDRSAMKPSSRARFEDQQQRQLNSMKQDFDKVQRQVDEFDLMLKAALDKRKLERQEQDKVWSQEDQESNKVAKSWNELRDATLKEMARMEAEKSCLIAEYLYYKGIYIRDGVIVAYHLKPFSGAFEKVATEFTAAYGKADSVMTLKNLPMEFEGKILPELKMAHFSQDPLEVFLIGERLPAEIPSDKNTVDGQSKKPEPRYGNLEAFYVLSRELDLFENTDEVIRRLKAK